MSLKYNRLKMVTGGFAALLLIEVVALVFANAELGRQQDRLKRGQRALNRLHNRAPFPAPENVGKMEANLDELEFQVGELAAVMQRDPFPDVAVGAPDFSARAQDLIEQFRKRAEQAGVFLPENLEVGFAQYASGGAVPAARHVPRLLRELYSVARVADVLVRAGVASIDELSRDVFEAQPDPAPEAPRRRERREAAADGNRRARAEESGGLYRIERVGIAFTAREEVVWRVLDLFAAMPHCMVVTEFSHETETDILSYRPEVLRQGSAAAEGTAAFIAGGILTGEKALSRPERLIAGEEPVRVELTVDVYDFKPEGGRNE